MQRREGKKQASKERKKERKNQTNRWKTIST